MQTYVIIASGESLSDHEISLVKAARDSGKIQGVIAVSNVGLDKAPWADFLVSHDSKWWIAYPESKNFKGKKISRHKLRGTEAFTPRSCNGCNSGLMAMEYARDILKAKRIILLGFDMKGTHYFGPHKSRAYNLPLRNTSEQRFSVHIEQFNSWYGPEVFNCNFNSALKKFPFSPLKSLI